MPKAMLDLQFLQFLEEAKLIPGILQLMVVTSPWNPPGFLDGGRTTERTVGPAALFSVRCR